jgi:RNase P subunit RPR2
MYKDHDWRTIDKWWARRRCQKCYAIGYLGLAIPDRMKKASKVYEYKCPKCHGPTTKYKGGRTHPCPRCRYPEPTDPEIRRLTLISDVEQTQGD